MSIDIYEIIEGPDDILIVNGAVDGAPAQARGWISAINNHYPASSYTVKGDRDDKIAARRMTDVEILAYAESLLAPAVVVDVEATKFDRIVVPGMKAKPVDIPIDITPVDIIANP